MVTMLVASANQDVVLQFIFWFPIYPSEVWTVEKFSDYRLFMVASLIVLFLQGVRKKTRSISWGKKTDPIFTIFFFFFFRAASLTWNGPTESCHFAKWPWKYCETNLNGKWNNTAVCILWTSESQWCFIVPHDHFPKW